MSDYNQHLREGEPPPLPAEAVRDYPTHPLFPLPEGVRETKEIYEITFDRWNDKGVKERCPDRFRASELTSLTQVVDLFGGGTYQFIAFDSRGNFSRWTPEKEKVRIDLPSKPFRQPERAEPGPQESAAHPAPRVQAPADYLAVMMQQSMQQSIAAQERADRLMAALLDRIAAPPPPPPPQPPSPDPVSMLSGLATILEKLRPAQQSGDTMAQLSGLVSIIKQLRGTQSAEASTDDISLQPFLTMMTNAMMQGNGAAARPAALPAQQPAALPPPPAQPTQPPDMVWVMLPDVGPVLMRAEQAARLAAARPATPAPSPAPSASVPALVASASSSSAPTPPAPSTSAMPPVPSTSAAPPVPSSSTPTPAVPTRAPATPAPPAAPPSPEPRPESPRAERCIVCAHPGRRDPAGPHVLLCPNGHRSLISAPPPEVAAPARPVTPPPTGSLQQPDGNFTFSVRDLDAMLADADVMKALGPDMAAALRTVRGQLGAS